MTEAGKINFNKVLSIPARLAVLMVCLLFLSGWRNPFDTSAARNRKANELYREKKYDEALKKYSDAQLDAPDSSKLHYNLGTALFRKKDYKGAASEFQSAASGTEEAIKGDALYNLGNSRFNLQKYQEAVKAYEGVLKLNPKDKQAKHNLEVARKLLEQQKQEQHDHKDQKQDEKKDQQKKDQEDKSSSEDKSEDKKDSEDKKAEQKKKSDEEKKQPPEDKSLKDEQKDKDQAKEQQKTESAERKPLDKDRMSKEEAERILDALKNDELQFQKERFESGREIEVEKDW